MFASTLKTSLLMAEDHHRPNADLRHFLMLYPVYTIKQISSKHQANVFKIHVHDV